MFVPSLSWQNALFLCKNGSNMPFFAGTRTHLIGSKWPTGCDARRSSLVILSASFPLMFGPRDCLGKSMGFSIRKAESVVCSEAFFSFFSFFSIRWLEYMRWCVSGCHSASHFFLYTISFSLAGGHHGAAAGRGGRAARNVAHRGTHESEPVLAQDFRCVVICNTKTRNFAKTGFGQAPDDFTKKGVCSMLSVSSWPIAR